MMYDENVIEISVEELEEMQNNLAELNELLEQIVSAYESVGIDLVEAGEVDLDEALERASKVYHGDQVSLENGMIWTAISYNWSVGLTNYFVFPGAHSAKEASYEFAKLYPGENLLALVAGHHKTSTSVYPLLTPGANLNLITDENGA